MSSPTDSHGRDGGQAKARSTRRGGQRSTTSFDSSGWQRVERRVGIKRQTSRYCARCGATAQRCQCGQ